MVKIAECTCCGRKFPNYKLASVGFREENCEDCIGLKISELEDALDTIRRNTAEYESDN